MLKLINPHLRDADPVPRKTGRTIYMKVGAGKQTMFATSEADGVLFGGGAGSGKTRLLQLESIRYRLDPTYTGIMLRRETGSITRPGGLWQEGLPIYHACGAACTESSLRVTFPKGGKLIYSHLQYTKDVESHQGAQYAYIGFDQLEEFEYAQFLGILARNRPVGGSQLKPYWRATANATSNHWINKLIDWWIDDKGYAIEERAGVLRWYTIRDDEIVWVDKDYRGEYGEAPQSFTFIPAKLDDNPVDKNWRERYRSILGAKDAGTRARLLDANWKYGGKGKMFESDWFILEDKMPTIPPGTRILRYYDMAATQRSGKDAENSAATSSARGCMIGDDLWILDFTDWSETPGKVETKMIETAAKDGKETAISWEQEKGSAGLYVSATLRTKIFNGYECRPDPVTGDKESRARPLAALAEHGHVHIVRGECLTKALSQFQKFYTPGRPCDLVDGASGLYKGLVHIRRIYFNYHPAHHRDVNIAWDKLVPEKVHITIALWGDKAYGVSGLFAVWGRTSKVLCIYDEIDRCHDIDSLVEQLQRKAVASLDSNSGAVIKVNKIFINERLSIGKDDMRRMLVKNGIRAKVNTRYDDAAGVLLVNSMFKDNKVIVDTKCEQTDRQLREWSVIEKESGIEKAAPNYPLCLALCAVLSDLREAKLLDKAPEPERGYTAGAKDIRDRMRNQSIINPVRKQVSAWER
jgi:phage terminase large subunit-like protein